MSIVGNAVGSQQKSGSQSGEDCKPLVVTRSHDIDGSCVEVLLVEDLLEEVGGSLGECELAEARIDGSEVGVDDLVESVVLHDVSFRSAWRRVSVFLFVPLAAAVSLCLLSIFFSSFFCCAFILRRANRQCHATIVTSFVKSSANLEEKVTSSEKRQANFIGRILYVSCRL